MLGVGKSALSPCGRRPRRAAAVLRGPWELRQQNSKRKPSPEARDRDQESKFLDGQRICPEESKVVPSSGLPKPGSLVRANRKQRSLVSTGRFQASDGLVVRLLPRESRLESPLCQRPSRSRRHPGLLLLHQKTPGLMARQVRRLLPSLTSTAPTPLPPLPQRL
jgi:hypothetical protein